MAEFFENIREGYYGNSGIHAEKLPSGAGSPGGFFTKL